MKKELEQKLFNDFPDLFADRVRQIECDSGWFEIIYEASLKINNIIKTKNLSCKVAQVKEKFGTLRYYMDSTTDEIQEIIKDAEVKSELTCEFCGTFENVKLRKGGWVKTLCNECNKK